jgi:hypothetical protein
VQSLLERVQSKQAPTIAPPGEPVLAESAGTVQWAVVEGARVQGWTSTLGEIVSSYGGQMIACGHVGTLAYIARDGQEVKRGEAIAYITPVEAPQKPASVAPVPTVAPVRKAAQRPTGEASDPTEASPQPATGWQAPAPRRARPAPAPIVQEQPAQSNGHNGNGRRSTMGTAEELLEVEEITLAAPIVPATNGNGKGKGKGKQKRERTKHHTTHLTGGQIRRVKKLSQRLDLDDTVPGCGEAELMRAAVELLLGLPEPALLAIIEQNRERERAGGYGTGYRRGPGA